MYPPEFDYYRAESVEHALELLDEHAEENPELLSGGHSLLPMIKSGLARPGTLIDIGHIDDLHGISTDGSTVSIGAVTTYAEIAADDTVREHVPALADAAELIGDLQVRNRGTLGGNVAHADPGADPPAVMRALDATIVAQGPDGQRRIDADEFFMGMYMTALDEQEILVEIELPVHDEDVHSAYVKRPDPASGYVVVGVAARLQTDGGEIEAARVAANGAMDYPVRFDAVEDALAGESLEESTLTAAAERAGESLDTDMLMEDETASAEYRADLLVVETERALLSVLEEATG